MLSIIISSCNEQYYSNLTKNISSTCGIPHEIIKIDNIGLMSINEAYNRGIEKSQYEYILCVHEDILFETDGWGHKIVNLFERDSKLGLVGVAGSRLKTKAPSAWGESGNDNNVIFINEYQNGIQIKDVSNLQNNLDTTPVAIVDGVFLSFRKSSDLLFDERLSGFHNYDVAFSIRNYIKGYNAVVTHEIIVSHYSAGNFDKSWIQSTLSFHHLYRNYLPISVTGKMPDRDTENQNYTLFANKCIHNSLFKGALKINIEFWKSTIWSCKPYYIFIKLFLYKIAHTVRSIKSQQSFS